MPSSTPSKEHRRKPPPAARSQTATSSAAAMGGGGGGHRRRLSLGTLSSGLALLSVKYRSLSKECLKTLRVEFQLHSLFHISLMNGKSYVNDFDAEEPEEFIVNLTGQISRTDEDIVQFVAPPRRAYVFGGISGISSVALIKALTGITAINSLGVRQIQRNCVALQQTLAAIGCNSPSSLSQSMDRVSEYYELLNRPYDALLTYAQDHFGYFSYEEYVALLKAKVPGRDIPPDAVSKLAKLLNG